MRSAFLVASILLLAGCGLRTGGRRLPDGGWIGTSSGCNKAFDDGNRVLEPLETPFTTINALQFDADGNLYVINRGSSTSWITMFGPSPNNDYVRTIGRSVLVDGLDFARAPDGTFWVLQDLPTSSGDPSVVHLSAEGELLTSFVVPSSEAGGLVLAPDGTLFVSIGRIAHLGADGSVLKVFGTKEPYIPHFMGMALDGRGMLWATDPITNTVEQFDMTGERFSVFGSKGPGPGMFDGTSSVYAGPIDIAVDSKGELYANDPLGSRIMKFSRQGTMLGQFGFGGAENVEPIAIDPKTGNLYVGRDNGVDIVCPL